MVLWNYSTSSHTLVVASHHWKWYQYAPSEGMYWLSIIWKSDLSGITSKHRLRHFYCMDTPHGCWQTVLRKGRRELHKNATSYTEQIQETTSHETTVVRSLTSHLKNHPNKTNKTCGTVLENQGRTHKWLSPMDSSNGCDSVGRATRIYNSFVWTQDVVWNPT